MADYSRSKKPSSKEKKQFRKNGRIDWTCGASTILFYMCLMWLIVMAVILFVELSVAFSGSSKSQLYSDLLADGSAYIGNSGWGLDEDEADDAYSSLIELNAEKTDGNFEDLEAADNEYVNTDSDGKIVRDGDGTNTVVSESTWSSEMISDSGTELEQTSGSATRITYSGGMRIVLEAWHHTYQYGISKGLSPSEAEANQTWYVYGGGHWGAEDEWKDYADCSGFVTGVYRECGYDVSQEYCTQQLERLGTVVGEGYDSSVFDNAMPGDIILFWKSGSAPGDSTHTGIYAGKYKGRDYMVHCSGTGQSMGSTDPSVAGHGEYRGAVLAQVPNGYWQHIKVVRIIDSTGTADQTSTGIVGLTADEQAVYYVFKEAGYSDVAIAALLGNLDYESGGGYANTLEDHPGDYSFNAWYEEQIKNGNITRNQFVYGGAKYGGYGGYGLAQWTTAVRKAKLWDISDGKVYDVAAQARLLLWEIEVGYDGDSWTYYRKVGSYLQNANDPAKLDEYTDYVLRNFEGIFDGSYAERRRRAHNFYSSITTSNNY